MLHVRFELSKHVDGTAMDTRPASRRAAAVDRAPDEY